MGFPENVREAYFLRDKDEIWLEIEPKPGVKFFLLERAKEANQRS